MLEHFEVIDVNDEQSQTAQLYWELLHALIGFSNEEIDKSVYETDLNSDGTIDYKEFVIKMCPEKWEKEK